ncbi:MAG TPA: PKD domain-containing protein [Bacteroidia bacterium]
MNKIITTIAIVTCAFLSKAQIITTIAGNGTSGYSGDGAQATAASFNNLSGVAFDAVGNLYIADAYNNRIRKVSTAGTITTIAGNGTIGFSGDGGAATAAELDSLFGVALDAAGNLYIADYNNYRVRKVTTAGIISTVAGNGTFGNSGDGGNATAAQIGYPNCITLDAVGNLYIADGGWNLIRKVNTAGIISTYAGNAGMGLLGDGGAATAASLNNPLGLALDGASNLYIADGQNSRIRKVTKSTGIINTIAGNGTYGYTGDAGQATAAALNYPEGVALDAAGNLYIADQGNRIRKINTSGIISTIAGNGTMGFLGDMGNATAAELYAPIGVVIDAAGNIYIADIGNNRIRMVSKALTTTVTVNSATICAGATTTLTASGASTYSWSTSATTASIIVTPTVTTSYTVAATHTFTAFNTPAVSMGPATTSTVTVNTLPTVSVNSGAICTGSSFTMSPSGANTYTFSSGSAVVTPTTNTSYSVTGTNTQGCVSSNTAVSTVTVNALPNVSVNSATICAGNTTTLTATGASTYTWNTSATGATITPTKTITTTYTVTGTDGNGCMNTATSTVMINPTNFGVAFSATQQLLTAPPFIAQFTNSTPSPSNYTFTWLFGDGTNQQTNNATVFHTYSYNGNYNVTLVATSNTTGCTDTLYQGGYIYCTGGATMGIQTHNQNSLNIFSYNSAIITNGSIPQGQQLKVINTLGQVVLTTALQNNIETNLPSGIYTIQVIDTLGSIIEIKKCALINN